MPTFAFLAPSERHSGISFEHEVFFFHFIARSMVNQYLGHGDMRVILSRSALPEFVANRFSYELRKQGRLETVDALQTAIRRLSKAGLTEWRRKTQVQENVGRIVLALIHEYVGNDADNSEISDATIESVFFPGGDLSGVTFRTCSLSDVSMRRTNLRSARFIGCNARNVLLLEPRIKVGSTRLELNGLHIVGGVVGVNELSDEGNRVIYDPHEIANVLSQCGLVAADFGKETEVRNVSPGLLELLDSLMRAYERANPVCVADDNLQKLFGDARWPILRDLLVEHGIVRPESRATSGMSKEFLRRQVSTEQIMSGINRSIEVDTQVSRFWEALESAST